VQGRRRRALLAGEPAVPLFYPAVYAVEYRRSRGLASSTIWNDEEALKHLLVWAYTRDIDLDAKFAAGDFLTNAEVASYARAAKQDHRRLRDRSADRARPVDQLSTRLNVGREAFRVPSPPAEPSVGMSLEDRRVRAAGDYLGWLADKTTPTGAVNEHLLKARNERKEEMLRKLKAYEPGHPKGNGMPKAGLTEEQQTLLLDAIRPDSPRNPWTSQYVRARNQALIAFLLGLGPRKGEAQKQQVAHVDLHRQQVSIVRNPDAIADDRRIEPNVKRVGRVLPLDASLSDLLSDYIALWRSTVPGSEKTDYLFLTVIGKPMSAEAVHKAFRTLREAMPELPENLSAHLLRHTWNDNYSITMDKNKVDPVNEARTRSYLMGFRSPRVDTCQRFIGVSLDRRGSGRGENRSGQGRRRRVMRHAEL
jgi:integrase